MTTEQLTWWDIEHGWFALRLHDQQHSLDEIAFLMNGASDWLADYVARFEQRPTLKAELMRRAEQRWPDDFKHHSATH